MIVFEKISVRNFLSIGNKPLEFTYEKGMHYVTGRDVDTGLRNGVGKSALCGDAITFALFGKTLRKSKVSDIVNRVNRRECEVSLDFSIGGKHYRIERGINPHYLRFTDDKSVEIELSKKKETQTLIEEVTKLTYDTFRNMIVMNINSSKNFMSMFKREKRELIEQVLSIDVLGSMYSLIVNDCNTVNSELKTVRNSYEITQNHYEKAIKQNEVIRKQIESHQDNVNSKIADIESQIRTYIDNIKAATSIADKLDSLNETKASYTIKYDVIKKNIVKLETKLVQYEKDVQKYIEELTLLQQAGATCPVCSNNLTDKHKEKEFTRIQNKATSIQSKIKLSTESLDKFRRFELALQLRMRALDQDILNASNSKNNIRRYTDLIKVLNQNRKEITETKLNIKELDISEIENEFAQLKEDLETTSRAHKNVSLLKSIFSDEGIKSYVIKHVLPIFNEKLKEYLQKLGSTKVVQFDDTLDEVANIGGRDVLSYDNFSAGEQKKVDLAILLTFVDLARLQGRVTTNLLVVDDMLSNSLEADANSLFLNILKEKAAAENMCILIASHAKDYDADLYNHIYILQKENNFTAVKNIF